MTTLADIRRLNRERERFLRAIVVELLDAAGDFCSTDVVDSWQARGRLWIDRRAAFNEVRTLLVRMREAGELVESRRAVAANGGGPARLYLRRPDR